MKPTDHLSPHFTAGELACKCCGSFGPNDGESLRKTARFLETVRSFLGNRPIHVNSGYRCPKHNAAVGGEEHSFHLKAYAADITVEGLSPARVQLKLEGVYGSPLERARKSPMESNGLGSYKTFTHVDRRGYRARWTG